ncbi:DUF4214 domain-containing protein [Betaproteobacteria bacterium]|nr:DUF4214 domain-containing protein [Betaproteobacteria bacterium]
MNEISAISLSISSQHTEASSLSSNKYNALLYGHQWSTGDITYSIINKTESLFSDDYLTDNLNELIKGSLNFNPIQAEAISTALLKWSNVTNINFSEIKETDNSFGTIRFGLSDNVNTLVGNSSAFAFFPSNLETGGDIWLNAKTKDIFGGIFTGSFSESSFEEASFSYSILVHEIGHALGLKHPFETSARNFDTLADDENVISNTIMSYTVSLSSDVVGLTAYPTTPMIEDIKAIQHLYGTNNTFNFENTSYFFDDSTTYFETIWDSGGTDEIVYSGTQPIELSLGSASGSFIGKRVKGYSDNGTHLTEIKNIYIADFVTIENASGGSGNDLIEGNFSSNFLVGGKGNDNLYGHGANDIFEGGEGNDFIYGGEGLDIALRSLSDFEVNYLGKQNFQLTSFGYEGTDSLFNVERIYVGNLESPTRIIGLDINQGESSGSVFRLYNAAFNRAPDGFEVGYHVNDIENNEFQLLDIARNFLLSPEFSKTYGPNQSDEDYVKTLYENVLNRTPEDFELRYYTDQFESFSTERAKTLLNFSESPENITLISPQIEFGIDLL